MRLPTLVSLATHVLLSSACLLDIEKEGGHVMDRSQPGIHRRQSHPNTAPVGTGDRFNNGAVVPRGVGLSPPGDTSTVYNSVEIRSAVKALVEEFDLSYFESPFKTYENRTIYGFRMGGKGKGKGKGKGQGPGTNSTSDIVTGFQVLLEAGIHARERGASDHLINFASDLLQADRANSGLQYGGMSYTASDVKKALYLGIIVVPVVNPDGLVYDQTTNLCWRKNRNPASAIPGNPNSVGVDLNRNFSPVWNFTQALVPGSGAASTNPSSELFHGTGPLSEAETKTIDWVLQTHPSIGWFLDVHSVQGVVLHGWCHDSNQATDPTMNLLNPAYDGKRGAYPDGPTTSYKEYLPMRERDAMSIISARMAGAMCDSTARGFFSLPAANFGASSGCSADQGNWRRAKFGGKWVKGFGIEFGYPNFDSPLFDGGPVLFGGVAVGRVFVGYLVLADDSFYERANSALQNVQVGLADKSQVPGVNDAVDGLVAVFDGEGDDQKDEIASHDVREPVVSITLRLPL
ncbi:hypothetical protein B0T14DRAFT_596927 [Immersiella caudata]|uniref:Peptidase M14 domain-containing protein n=1 Tax=Immersiella caudata TaxID=314043 RepID=A0AA40CA61_9PEZI|nr:hypothetical protein B0T14DRAFT_596927 [Immersiella caudata]